MTNFARIAHRGAPRRALENTMESFSLARQAGARFFELDVWLSRDGVPMVFHDKNLNRIAGRRERISQLSRSQLQNIHLPGGESIPTLRQVLGGFKDPGHMLYIEIKDPGSGVVSACLGEAMGHPSQWALSSFNLSHLRLAKSLYPGVKTKALVDRLFMRRAAALPGDEIGLSEKLASPRVLAQMKRLGKPLFVYTVNHPGREAQLRREGVAGVYTDTW